MNENMMNRSYEVQVEGDSLGRYTAKTFGWHQGAERLL